MSNVFVSGLRWLAAQPPLQGALYRLAASPTVREAASFVGERNVTPEVILSVILAIGSLECLLLAWYFFTSREDRRLLEAEHDVIDNSPLLQGDVNNGQAARSSIVPKPSTDDEAIPDCAAEILSVLFREETRFQARPDYMKDQLEITDDMRAVLIDWLVQVHRTYKLRSGTLFLAVNVLDRYLARASIVRTRLQLVGVVALLIAAKFEEIDPPTVVDLVHVTDSAFTKNDILQLECQMLITLDFKITAPVAPHFFERFQRVNQCDDLHRELAMYILELSLVEISMIRHTPSRVVSAALLLSNEVLGSCPAWPFEMSLNTQLPEHDLRECAEELRALLESAPEKKLVAVQKKYAHTRHGSVSSMAIFPAPKTSGAFKTSEALDAGRIRSWSRRSAARGGA